MSHVRLAQLMVNGRPVRRVPAKERLQAFKAGTGIYGGDGRARWALRRRRAGRRTLWRACVDDAEQLEPYVGADRAWKLASGWWFMDATAHAST